ncbi:zinc finger protein 112-like [Penaeus chinensis]|uniref:zinc finger protein 112-like n=1 Tax=Penaeus chinensis TaxID=139456 RepID=UPI001FB7D5BF|nr:zinc finger protein 112-like [Penaeus chinensis]XP_047499574.1 zinc finger protein 112-like [Penaeus chinensis]
MDDSGLEENVEDSALEFITVKEENIEDISDENCLGIKEEVIENEDKHVRNAIYIKTENLYRSEIPISKQTKFDDGEEHECDSDNSTLAYEDPLKVVPSAVDDYEDKSSSDGVHKEGREKVPNKIAEAIGNGLVCDVCSKKCICKSQLLNHMRVHTREKPYTCEVCSKGFPLKHHLVVHMRIHTKEKPFSCELCSKSFSQKTTLVKHMRVHRNEKPYTCEVCSKAFSDRSNLMKHMRIHTQERPYSCEICSSAFSQKTVLIKHMRVHTKEKPFSCDVCNRPFSERSSLLRHKKLHNK